MLLALTSNVDVYLHWLQMLMVTCIDFKRWRLLALTSNVDVTCIDFKGWWLLALTSNVDVTCIQRLMVTCIDF